LHGVSPVVVAIVAQALWKFGQTAMKSTFTIAVAVLAFVAALLRQNEMAILASAVFVGLLWSAWQRKNIVPPVDNTEPSETNSSSHTAPAVLLVASSTILASPSVGHIFLLFLKIGTVLYGSGYVLLSFIHQDFVQRLGWISEQQLLDAVAFGQFTPGPLFTTATFIGYQLAGVGGAVAATVGIFLPSFIFVALLVRVLERLQASSWMRPFLDAVMPRLWR
jgi:chromate transporter